MWKKIRKSLPWSIPVIGFLLYGLLTYVTILTTKDPTRDIAVSVATWSIMWVIIVLVTWIVALVVNRKSKHLLFRYLGLIALIPVFWLAILKFWGFAFYNFTVAQHSSMVYRSWDTLMAFSDGLKTTTVISIAIGVAFFLLSRTYKNRDAS